MDKSSSAIEDDDDDDENSSCFIEPTEGTGDGDDCFRDDCWVFDVRDAVRRNDGKSYISKPEGNNDAPSCSADARK